MSRFVSCMQWLRSSSVTEARNLAAFWLLGLCNNFAYVIMLSAAHDILHPAEHSNNVTNASAPNRTDKLVEFCNPIGTGAILLADILPALLMKLTAPLYVYFLPYSLKVWIVVLLGTASFPLVAYGGAEAFWLSIIGVICASAGSGLGEVTFLSLSSHFSRNSVSTWSSGTGAAGVLGALSYAGLTALGFSPKNSLLLMLIIPASLLVTYFVILVKPHTVKRWTFGVNINNDVGIENSDEYSDHQRLLKAEAEVQSSIGGLSVFLLKLSGYPSNYVTDNRCLRRGFPFMQRLLLIKPLLKFMIPLFLVYFAEYFINQGLFELIYYKNMWLPRMQQYRWYQVIYQIGVFLSRSSVNLIHIKWIYIFPLLQFVNVIILTCEVFYKYIPNIWIIFFIILFEGLMGGGAYVNTFYRISEEVPSEHREFSMGVTSISDSLGISLAAAVAIPVHNYICQL